MRRKTKRLKSPAQAPEILDALVNLSHEKIPPKLRTAVERQISKIQFGTVGPT